MLGFGRTGHVAVCLLCFACSGGGSSETFGAAPAATVTDGVLDVQVFVPTPLVRGVGEVKLVVRDAAGAPVDGLSVDLQPWMPAMGHGSSTVPVVTGAGGGVYVASDVALLMAGEWQLRTTVSGAVADSFVAEVSVE
jgi:YtkA-like protein